MAIDHASAVEIQLYIDNTSQMLPSFEAVIKNLHKKIKSGKYNPEKAVLLWMHLVKKALQMYQKEFGSPGDNLNTLANVDTRKYIARQLAKDNYERIINGEFNYLFHTVGKPKYMRNPNKIHIDINSHKNPIKKKRKKKAAVKSKRAGYLVIHRGEKIARFSDKKKAVQYGNALALYFGVPIFIKKD